MKFEIRPARAEDIDWLLGQLKKFSDFFGTKLPLLGGEEYSRFVLSTFMEEPHLMLIAASGETKVGFIAGIMSPHIYNPAITVLTESFWWVDEEYRGSRAGLQLLDGFMAFGKENADWINFTLEEKSPVSEKCLLKRGFRLQERSYLLETD